MGALIVYGLPARASVGAVFVSHAISISVSGLGGRIAWLSTPRAGTIERPTIGPFTARGVPARRGDRDGRLAGPGAETDRAFGSPARSVVKPCWS